MGWPKGIWIGLFYLLAVETAHCSTPEPGPLHTDESTSFPLGFLGEEHDIMQVNLSSPALALIRTEITSQPTSPGPGRGALCSCLHYTLSQDH